MPRVKPDTRRGSRPEPRERLREFLAQHRNPERAFSLSDIAREIGCSRQTVAFALPGYHEARKRFLRDEQVRLAARLARFAATHPDAVSNNRALGWSFARIGEHVGIPESALAALWRELHLPIRYGPHATPEEKAQRKSARQRSRLSKVLRTETCVACGKRFPWTVGCERDWRVRGRRVVCSRLCGRNAARSAREGL